MTTRLDSIKAGEPYTWGDVVKIHEIGMYSIIEFIDREHLYAGYVDGVDMHHTFTSLDAALAGCIAYKHEGPNHKAGYYFMQMLKQGD